MEKIRKVEGEIILDSVLFNRLIERIVMKNNETSGKVTLPKSLIGKKILVVWEDD